MLVIWWRGWMWLRPVKFDRCKNGGRGLWREGGELWEEGGRSTCGAGRGGRREEGRLGGLWGEGEGSWREEGGKEAYGVWRERGRRTGEIGKEGHSLLASHQLSPLPSSYRSPSSIAPPLSHTSFIEAVARVVHTCAIQLARIALHICTCHSC